MTNGNGSTPVYLPAPSPKGSLSLEETITRRRSVRDFSSESITRVQLPPILWAAQGLTDKVWGLRTVPSAGATYPLEVYAVCGHNSVEGMGEGVYRYNAARHYLNLYLRGDVRLDLARAALGQEFICEAPVDIVICALFRRTTRGYGNRGERYVHIEVGHAGQNIYQFVTPFIGNDVYLVAKLLLDFIADCCRYAKLMFLKFSYLCQVCLRGLVRNLSKISLNT